MIPEIFSREDARREGLSYNPILTILETTSALKRNDFKDPLFEGNFVSLAEQKIFEHHGVRRRLFFTVAAPGKINVKAKAKEFTGFQKTSEGDWTLKLGIDAEEYVSVSGIANSMQIQNFREERVHQEK